MEIDKKDLQNQTEKLEQKFKQQTEEIKRANVVLYEKFRDDIKIIGEGWDAVRQKTDATFEMVGDIKEDVEIMKMDVSFIKNGLKQKADKDELESLEKRVLFLENKLKRT